MTITLIAAFLLHPVHETVSEVEWNAKSGRMEVSLRMSLLDEQWIQRNIDTKKAPKIWAIGYLKNAFRFYPVANPARSQTTKGGHEKLGHKYHWVGRKEDGSHVWWFFEVEPVSKKKPVCIGQRVLF